MLLAEAQQVGDHEDYGADDDYEHADDDQHDDLIQLLALFQIEIICRNFLAQPRNLLTVIDRLFRNEVRDISRVHSVHKICAVIKARLIYIR